MGAHLPFEQTFYRHETPVTVFISRDCTCNGFLLFIESRACGFGWVKSIMTSRQDSSPIGGEKRVQAEGRRSSSYVRKLNRSNKKRHKAAMNGGRDGDVRAVWFRTADHCCPANQATCDGPPTNVLISTTFRQLPLYYLLNNELTYHYV